MSQNKDNNYRTYNKYFIFLVLIAIAIFFLSSDKVGSALTVLAILIAVLTAKTATDTLKLTDESLELTRNSFELTKKALERAKIEQEIRDLEKSLNYFYYPISNYFYIKTKKAVKGGVSNEDTRDRIHAESFRYLAEERTREQVEVWRKEGYTNGDEEDKLKEYIDGKVNINGKVEESGDIREYENKLKKLKNRLENLK